jgi:hypothetical protein
MAKDKVELPGYMRAKIELYLRLGPARYRRADAFRMPPAGTSKEVLAAMRAGYEQLLAGRGLERGVPLEKVGVHALNLMMSTLHFDFAEQSAQQVGGAMLDKMVFEHRVDASMRVTVFNLVEYDAGG